MQGEHGVLSIEVSSFIDAAIVRALAKRFAACVGLSALRASQVAICAGELATNMVKYAKQGRIILQPQEGELLLSAQDPGAGILDLAKATQDGFCDGAFLRGDERLRKGLGCGLGAVLRLMDRVEFIHPPSGGFCVNAWKKL